MGTVLHPKGNIAEFLLKEGYAKVMDKSMSLVTSGVQALLRESEK
jgi:staphylococcal nuclease domain-containing protein 1